MRNFIIMTVMLFAATVIKASEPTDTLVVRNAQSVKVISGDSLLRVSIDGTKENPDYHYDAMIQTVDSNFVSQETLGKDFSFDIMSINKHKEIISVNTIEFRLALGLNTTPGAPGNMKTSFGSSADVSGWINWRKAPFADRRHSFAIGIGASYKWYRMTGRNQFVKATDGTVSIEPLPEGCDPKLSRIRIVATTIPLEYRYTANNKWGFAFSPIINFTCSGKSKILTRYSLDGNKYKLKYKDIHPNPVTIDLMASLVTPWADIYVKYNPCNILDTRFGPKFHSLSFGIAF